MSSIPVPVSLRSSPPVPLSLRERGDYLCDWLLEPCLIDVLIANPDYLVSGALEPGTASGVVISLRSFPVLAAVELYDELQLGAVEIDDESPEDMLATELEAEYAAIAEQRPRMPFCGGRLTARLSGQGELPPDGDAP